jgi:voltage-gated potassium channel
MENDFRDQHPWIHIMLQVVILYGAVTMVLETVPDFAGYATFFSISEAVCVGIFTIEYLACWALSNERLRYPFRLLNIVDLLAILPFYLQPGIDFRVLRSLRFLRIFRILKLARYGRAVDTLKLVVRQSTPELAVTGLLAALIMVISSMLLYYAEHEAQPDRYSSVPAAMWSAVVTLTTVGYGDVYPVTVTGRVIAVFIMLAGISFIAIPTGLVSSRLTEILTKSKEPGAELLLIQAAQQPEK